MPAGRRLGSCQGWLIRRFVLGGDLPLHLRVAACLLLLYAQPLSRIVRLTASDITRDDDGQAYLRFGTPPAPVPEPFAAMLAELASAAGDGDACLSTRPPPAGSTPLPAAPGAATPPPARRQRPRLTRQPPRRKDSDEPARRALPAVTFSRPIRWLACRCSWSTSTTR